MNSSIHMDTILDFGDIGTVPVEVEASVDGRWVVIDLVRAHIDGHPVPVNVTKLISAAARVDLEEQITGRKEREEEDPFRGDDNFGGAA